MKVLSTNRYAAAGVAGAVALGTVVSVGALTPATAAAQEVTATYTCVVAGAPVALPVTTVLDIPAQVTAGRSVPGMPVQMGVPLPAGLVDVARMVGAPTLSGVVDDAAFGVGGLPVAAPDLAAPPTAIPATGGMLLPVAGSTRGFTAPAAGTHPVTLPTSFELVASGTPVPVAIPCSLAQGAPTDLGVLNVLAAGEEAEPADKQQSNTRAWIKKAPVTVGERGRLRVRVTDEEGPAVGKVVVRLDGERLTRKALNDRGRTGVRLPKLTRGKHVVVVKYLGRADTERSRDRVRFRVRRG